MATQRRVIDQQLARERLFANVSTAFSVLVLLLASIGIYGVVAYATARRTGEIGIRMALGARSGNIIWLMLRRMVIIVGLGVAVGLGAALAVTRLIESMLWQVTANDPATLIGAAALLIVVAPACWYDPCPPGYTNSPNGGASLRVRPWNTSLICG